MTLYVKRILDDDSHLRIMATYHLDSDPSKNITATSYFERTGPSPKQEEVEAHAASTMTASCSTPHTRSISSASVLAARVGMYTPKTTMRRPVTSPITSSSTRTMRARTLKQPGAAHRKSVDQPGSILFTFKLINSNQSYLFS